MHKDFIADGTVLTKYSGEDTSVEVPEGITEIKDSAFWGLDKLESVALPGTIEKIEIGYFGKYDAFSRQQRRYGVYKTKPPWSIKTIGSLSDEIARLISRNWLSQMMPEDWAILYLTQKTGEFRRLFKKRMADKPNEYLSEMIKLLKEGAKTLAFTRAAFYAAEHHTEIEREILEELSALTKLKRTALGAAEILDSFLNPKEVDKNSPYAWLYERFDEPKLLKRYREYGGKVCALKGVRSADGRENVPQIAVLAAVVPYLDFFDEEFRSDPNNTKLKILPESDKAAGMMRRSSLMNFIRANTDIERNTKWLYPYCRYASEGEIENFISEKKKYMNGNGNFFYDRALPSNALLLSDCCASKFALYAGDSFMRSIGEYAKIRSAAEDAVVTDIGLDEHGKIYYDLGAVKITAVLTRDFELILTDEASGSSLGCFPETCASASPRRKAEADFNRRCGYLKKAVRLRTEKLFEHFLNGTPMDFKEWKRTNFANAVNKLFAELLVWEQNGAAFTVKDGKLINACGKEYAPSDGTVRLAHPMEMSAEDINSWREYIIKSGIKQPFIQIEEPVIDLYSVKEDRYKDAEIPLSDFSEQSRHGIRFNPQRYDLGVEIDGCLIKYEYCGRTSYWGDYNRLEIYKFEPVAYGRKTNHAVSLLDKWAAIERIKNDDMSVLNTIEGASAAQLAEYVEIAIENECRNLTPKLLDLKKERFPEVDSMDEFTLGDW